jgi:hypothetical protein
MVTLGSAEAREVRWSTPRLVAELASDAVDDNPTLTGDQLEIFFTSRRDGGAGSTDIWYARRTTVLEPFGAPEPVVELNTAEFESSPAVSADGLTLWFGSAREGSLGETDIWKSVRATRDAAWSEPEHVPQLSSEAADIPRPPGYGGRVMPLASRRNGGIYWTYFAERGAVDAEFAEPRLVEELASPDASVVDAFLTEDGLTLWFNRTPVDGTGDLYRATRASVTAPFEAPDRIDELSTAQEERDPWISSEGRTLYFASDREGELQIYVTEAL